MKTCARRSVSLISLMVLGLVSVGARAATSGGAARTEATRWAARFAGVAENPRDPSKVPASTASVPPFSFEYDGRAFADGAWSPAFSTRSVDAVRTERTLRYAHAPTGLEVRCVMVEYADFPVVEWTVYFKNNGAADTPILEDILALDATFGRGGEAHVLHHNVGSPCAPNDFQPLETPLAPGVCKRIAGRTTRSGSWGGRAADC